jgi:hypothetical protein
MGIFTIENLLELGLLIATVAYACMTLLIININKRQVKLQHEAFELEAFMHAVNFMEEVRADRAIIRTYIKSSKKWSDMKKDGKLDNLDKVCRAFDVLGLLDRHKLVNQDLVDRFYAPPLVQLWEGMMGSYVDELRKPENRGKTHYWELDSFYRRVQNVPQKHPGVTGLADWPLHPRNNDFNN